MDNSKFRHLDVCDLTFEWTRHQNLTEHPPFAAVHRQLDGKATQGERIPSDKLSYHL